MKGARNQVEFRLVERKSVFLAIVCPVDGQEEFDKKLKEIKTKYADATHVTFGVKVGSFVRESDAKEPSHVAGSVILQEMAKAQLDKTAIFVVRYFGGTKLGKVGLKEAYRKAAAGAIAAAVVGDIVLVCEAHVDLALAQKICKKVENLGAKVSFGLQNATICFKKEDLPSDDKIKEIFGEKIEFETREVVVCQ